MFRKVTPAALVGIAVAIAVLAPAGRSAAGHANCTSDAGQAFIQAGRYDKAIQTFTCVIAGAATEAEGYRGRAEAELLLGRYSDAMADYGRITALVEPSQPG